ncbi:hypothetical protein [Polyangium jinanense]|uniref:Uncharacterized protein n=1 Tax=Polyangium jinanense TaxID=2829994 RepID=A0A9X3X2W3_9BACT|nr:hypothetical protein [Polyangium jinanense]MDC3952752.1 hypothetical protein [Polyangium jinanense]MDC3980371.1 hypothetical protein [Polyangium jinanense]
MIGKIFITSSGYDPELGKHVKDPYLGDSPSLGACRPDIRKKVFPGDHIFTISGKVRGIPQFVMGGFEVAAKVHANDAYRAFPEQRLRRLDDGQLTGNVVVNAEGHKHPLDTHKHNGFDQRLENYLIGKNPIALVTPQEIARGRSETLEVLCEVLKKQGMSPKQVVGRFGTTLNEEQVLALRAWLQSIKRAA